MFYTQKEKLNIVKDLEVRVMALRAALHWGYDLSDQKASIKEMRLCLDSLEEIVDNDISKINQ